MIDPPATPTLLTRNERTMSNAAELLTKSSYCRNSKHARCKTVECGCKCHAERDAVAAKNAEAVLAKNAALATTTKKPSKAPKAPASAPKPKARTRSRAKKAAPPPEVNLTGVQKRALREQMVTYLAAMPFELGPEMGDGCLDGVTPDQAAAYVDQYWVKFIDPARFNGRAIIGTRPGTTT